MRTILVNLPVICCLLVAGYAEVEQVASIDLYYSGDVQGSFEPCGCKAGPTGGPARRAGVTLDSRDAVHRAGLHIDAGNYFAGPGPGAAAVNDFMQYSLDFIPVEVMNLGADDLYWWPELSKLEQAKTQFISTNLRPRESGMKAPARYAVVELSAGQLGVKRPVRIGFLGIVDPGLVKPNSKLRAEDPLSAIREVRDEVLKQADFLIVLADLIRPQVEIEAGALIRQIAEDSPSVYAIITTEKRFVLYPPQQIGSAVVLSSVERGRFLGQLTLGLDEEGRVVSAANEYIELKEGVPEEPELKRRQDRISSATH